VALQPTASDAIMTTTTGGQSKQTRGCVAPRQPEEQGALTSQALRPSSSLNTFAAAAAAAAARAAAAAARAAAVQQQQQQLQK